MAIQAHLRAARGVGATDRPRSSQRQDLVTVLLATWLIAGIGLDGWAHSNLLEGQQESFFTPWHGVFYSGFVATALWVLWLAQTRRAHHPTWTQAVPRGYGLGLVGVATIIVALDEFRAWENLLGAAAAGLVVDAAIARLRPAADRVGAFRAVGSLVPMAVIGCTFLAAVWRFGLGWPAELWTGTVVFGGLAGYALAFLMQPTPLPRPDLSTPTAGAHPRRCGD